MAADNGGTVTQCAHIFDASTIEKLGGRGSDKVHFSTCLAYILIIGAETLRCNRTGYHGSFGYKDIAENLNGKGVHHLENILTLDMVVHESFDNLRLWFEPTVGILLFYVKHI